MRHGQIRQQTHPNSFYPHPITGSKFLQNCTPAQQDPLLGNLGAAETAHATEVQRGTHEDHARSWQRWKEYCESAGLEKDIFLEQLPKQHRRHILRGFAVAMREGRFSRPCDAPLASGTISSAISHVAATFRSHGYPNPSHDKNGALDWNLSCQYRSYKNSDPKEIQQKAIPLSVISLIAKLTKTKTQKATSQLIITALFFACRSCKYLKVPNPQDKKTKILMLKNIAFYLDNEEIPHSSASALSSADRVLVTFVTQKNGRKINTITQWRTNHATLCPVIQWAAIVNRINGYKGTTPATPVFAVWTSNKLTHMTSKMIETALRDGVVAFGETKLRIQKHKVGTHSIQSGSAMAMYLGGVPVFAIMMIGRWSSDAFMKYICKQIKEFTFNVSKKMLTMQHFRYVPNKASNNPNKKEYGGSASLMLLSQ
jgi:hypothetical protein